MALNGVIMEAPAHCYSRPNAQSIGTLRLYQDKLVWEPTRGAFWLTKFLVVPTVEIHPTEIISAEACRVGLSHGMRVRTATREYLFVPREGHIPIATKRTASKWLDALLNLAATKDV